MKVLLFEWLTGGGLWHDQIAPNFNCSMQRQGREMLAAMVVDFIAAGIQAELPIDQRLKPWLPTLSDTPYLPMHSADAMVRQLVHSSQVVDHIMLIAPECNSTLLNCIDWIKQASHKLISPGFQFAKLASSKTATIDALRNRGFQALPNGMRLSQFLKTEPTLDLPAVLKPDDGAGSEGVQQIADWREIDLNQIKSAEQTRIESFVSGTPVSVSVLCGDAENQILVPTGQVFDREPFGHYVNAQFPLPDDMSQRAIRLAADAIESLPGTRGYIGIDMIIRDTEPGFDGQPLDCLIEVNPRLTTSYLKLREIYPQNLAVMMLQTATSAPEIESDLEEDFSGASGVKKHCIFRAPNP